MNDSDKSEILPCPFCGGKAALEVTICDARIYCETCRSNIIRQNGRNTEENVMRVFNMWNTRHESTEVQPTTDSVTTPNKVSDSVRKLVEALTDLEYHTAFIDEPREGVRFKAFENAIEKAREVLTAYRKEMEK